MARLRSSGAVWFAVYALFIAAMPFIAAVDHDRRGREFLLEFSAALGFIGLAMMWAQFALTARFRWVAPGSGLDTLMQIHRQAGISAFALVLAHPVLAIAANDRFIHYLDPGHGVARAAALWVTLLALVAILGSSLWRKALGIRYEWWRLAHAVLATLIVFIGLVHVLRVGFYIDVPWKQALWSGLTAGAIGLLGYTRVLRPLRMLRKPYRVAEVRREPGSSWTVVLEPVGHPGMRFAAGQFAWVTIGASPFSLEQHPFSFASSAEAAGRVEFTIKELGDWTAKVGQIPLGTKAYLDGPYGGFTLRSGTERIVGIAGGVGITPLMSILRTWRDRGDRRPAALLYAAGTLEGMVYREELEAMARERGLELTLLPREAPPGWPGPSGLPNEALIRGLVERHGTRGTQYLVCGPPPLMDLAERTLLKAGVPAAAIRAERFDIA